MTKLIAFCSLLALLVLPVPAHADTGHTAKIAALTIDPASGNRVQRITYTNTTATTATFENVWHFWRRAGHPVPGCPASTRECTLKWTTDVKAARTVAGRYVPPCPGSSPTGSHAVKTTVRDGVGGPVLATASAHPAPACIGSEY
jgi:hypothetical protein